MKELKSHISETKNKIQQSRRSFAKTASVVLSLIVFAVLIAGVNLFAFASDALTAENGLQYAIEDGYATITYYESEAKEIVVPSEIDGYKVTCLKNIRKAPYLEHIVVSDGIESCGDSAFYGCKQVQSIQLPDSIVSLGKKTFYDCINLESMVLPKNITTIPRDTFYLCKNLKSVIIPDKVTIVDEQAFCNCTSLKEIDIPDSVVTINFRAFAGNTALESVKLPSNLEYIGYLAFDKCSSLKTITIPQSELTIDIEAFYGSALESVEILSKDCQIEEKAFNPNTTIYGWPNSTAEQFAAENGNDFVPLHIWNEGEIVKLPTCSEYGLEFFACEECGATKTENIAKTKHTEVADEAVAATCTSTGLTAGSHCLVCNEVVSAQEVVPVTEHIYNQGKVIKNPTCTQEGTKLLTCTVCGAEKTEPISVADHQTVIDKAVAPTCTKTGLTEGSHCSVCNIVFTVQSIIPAIGHKYDNVKVTQKLTCDQQGIIRYTCVNCSAVKEWAVEPAGHKIVIDNAVAPTCIYAGKSTGSHCSVCNKVITPQEKYSPSGHRYDEGKIIKAATCLVNGTKVYTCSVCGDIHKEIILSEGHKVAFLKASDPTCTKTGKTEGAYCTVCNCVIQQQKLIPIIEHSYDTKITQEATCTAHGIKTYTCTTCGATKTETIKSTGHKAVTDKAVAATCTKAGKTEGTHCSVCGIVITAQKAVAATGHTYDKGKVTKAATCTANGVKTYTCTKCKATKTEIIKAAGHKAVTDKAVSATCTKAGKTEGTHCSVCNTVITGQKPVPATGHSYKTMVTKANINKNGSSVTKCTKCGNVSKKSTIYYPKTVTLSSTAYTYDGKVKKPGVTVKDSAGKTIAASNYTVTYPSGRKNVGTYTVKITFKGNYSGSVSKTFKINPKNTSISSVTAQSKAFTVKLKKYTTQTTGYQIQYSTSSDFKNAKTVTVKNTATSKKISKLEGNKKYYIRIRTYKTAGKANYYSGWSAVKTVITKK